MAKSGAVLTLKGFDDVLENIQKANAGVDDAAERALKAGAGAFKKQLITECNADGVPQNVTSEIKMSIEKTGNEYSAKIGWELSAYDPKKLTQGYKALFLNYGTPHRKKNGQVRPRGFIGRAKKNSKKTVKAAQKTAFDRIIKGLK